MASNFICIEIGIGKIMDDETKADLRMPLQMRRRPSFNGSVVVKIAYETKAIDHQNCLWVS